MQKVSRFRCESILLTKSNILVVACWYGSSAIDDIDLASTNASLGKR